MVSPASLGLLLAAVVFLILWLKAAAHSRELTRHYAPILDIDRAIADRNNRLDRVAKDLARAEADAEKRNAQLSAEYSEKRALLDRLIREVAVYEDTLELAADGLYKPHYDFDTPEKYKTQLDEIRRQQKEMVKAKLAVVCQTEWQVGGSKAEGRKLTAQYTRLMLRAFNAESDAAVADTTWNNASKMEERLRKAYEAINACGSSHNIRVMPAYLDLKLAELRLAYEHEQKKQSEKEEQRRIREEQREEEKVRVEIEKAQAEAEADERRFAAAIEKARGEVARTHGAKLDALNAKIAEMEARLAEAQANKQRALSRAQLTKSGHVYVISNIGSFGENVFKIGMTRRLEPMERVKELGDASVPFSFDVHALIYTEDAPKLESELQKAFASRRVNMINERREFFRVPLTEIAEAVRRHDARIEFTELAEAREYRETLALITPQQPASPAGDVRETFPASI